ncbi:hypothetical protein HYH03_014005 [Edaphochlamys debaryana]|uniref:Uncharacterized protein n=1 Tax=Edaphochlamys debaryana TaxID=47281 RepID=A0A836BU07_9CHLO|nr:hypothetical protein HYH03_014005 [Edaphochlamys debaryana]|eukprot:KAG2487438.1 hypothetical protein HYH03_014005 [Edaphochlamys debaryana]
MQYLMERGVPKANAHRLVALRDQVAARVPDAGTHANPTASSVLATAKEAPPGTARVGAMGPDDEADNEAKAGPDDEAAKPADSPTQTRKESLVAMGRNALVTTRVVLEALGPSLPMGSEVANLVVGVLKLVETAVANKSNLLDLQDRALAFLDILEAYKGELEEQKLHEMVKKYKKHLEAIGKYARKYSSCGLFVQLLKAGIHAKAYEQLAARMKDLGDEVMMLVGVDTNARLQAMQGLVVESKALLDRVVLRQDPSTEVFAFVEQYGGLEAVVAAGKLGLAVEKLDISSRVTIEMISSLVGAYLDDGPHQQIPQLDLRLFWVKQFGKKGKVPWYTFWDAFPSKLKDTLPDEAQVEGLCALLAEEGRREALQRALERSDSDTLSVWELRKSFNGDEDLFTQIRCLLDGQGLPPLPPHYAGREAEAEALITELQQCSILLHGPGGIGKSSLAADVAARLLRAAGGVARRALWVGLREAGSAEEVEARFCAALGVQREMPHAAAPILAALRALADKAAGGGGGKSSGDAAVVVVVDNAEDALLHSEEEGTPLHSEEEDTPLHSEEEDGPLHSEEEDAPLPLPAAEALRGLLRKVLAQAPTVRLLVTSRTPLGGDLGLEERRVGAISPEAATQLLQKAVAGLSHAEAAEVAAACRWVPLVRSLVAEALAYGRLTLEDLPRLTEAEGRLKAAVASSDGDPTSATVRLALASLPAPDKQAAACLVVFPGAFDDEAAAAVFNSERSRAKPHAVLSVLLKHGVLQRADRQQRYAMHMLVRQHVVTLGAPGDPTFQARAEGRFVVHMLRLLRKWDDLNSGNDTRRGVAMKAADQQHADLGRLFELLKGLTPEHGGPCETWLAQLESTGPGAAAGQRVDVKAASTLYTLYTLLGRIHDDAHRYEKAEPLYRQALELAQRVLGPDDPETIDALHSLAGCLESQGRYQEGEALYRQALELVQRRLGPQNPDDSAGSSVRLADCLESEGRFQEAEVLYRQALELWKGARGPENRMTINSEYWLAKCLQAQGRFEETEPLFREAFGWRVHVLGPTHESTVATLNDLTECRMALGDPDAERLLHSYWSIYL